MSIELMTLAFKTPFKPSPKVYLLTLCDHANDDGECFPSLTTLTKKCSMGKTNITYIAKAYETLNLIERVKRNRPNGSDASTLYKINISKLTAIALSKEDERKQYLAAYDKAYNKARPPEKLKKNHSVNTSKKTEKNHSVNTTPVHSSEHLEPSYINQEEISKDISSSKKRRETYKDFKERIIREYAGQPLVKGAPGYLQNTVISVSITGFLHNEFSNKDLEGDEAIPIWQWLYINQEKIIPIQEVQTG